MACGCSKNKSTSNSVTKRTTSATTKATRPLSEGGRTRRAERRIIR